MVSYPSQDKIVYGIVCGGDDSDPDPTQSGGFRVYLPGEYGPDVQREHLPFSRNLSMGTEEGVTKFNPPPERGAAVVCLKTQGHSGTGHLLVLGTLPNEVNNDDVVPGNIPLATLPVISESILHKINVLIPPNIKEVKRKGALVRKVVEKGVKHSHDIVKGIPSSATAYSLTGMQIPQMTNVSTAVDAFTAIITKEIAGQFPGEFLNLGDLFNLFSSSQLAQLENGLERNVFNALRAMIDLMQNMSFQESAGFLTAIKVDIAVFLEKALELLLQAKTVYDVITAIQFLQGYPQATGPDFNLPGFVQPGVNPASLTSAGVAAIRVKTPFGEGALGFDEFGNLINVFPPEIQALIQAFLGLLGNAGLFPSVHPDKNFFGETYEAISEMLPRLTPKEYEKAKKQLETAVPYMFDPRIRLNSFQKRVMTGRNILDVTPEGPETT